MKITKVNGGALLSGEMPEALLNSGTLEIFELKKGAYLVTVKGFVGNSAEHGQKARLLPNENELLRKLSLIRFENRVPEEVDQTLSQEEKKTLASLISKGFVEIFHGRKYKSGGVYNIPDFAYSHAKEYGMQPAVPAQEAKPEQPAAARQSPKSANLIFLEKNGWLILESEQDAKYFGNETAEAVKAGTVSGLKSFDGKYYFITKKFSEEAGARLKKSLEKSEKTADELARETNIPAEGCRALLAHLGESGDLLEKKKGKYALA